MTTKTLTPVSFQPTLSVPHQAPPPPMDLTKPDLSFDDVLPSNYFSMEDLEIWLLERQAESRVLHVTGCSVEYVFDPEKGEASGEWKPCLAFADTATLLVINKTRGQQLKQITHSPFLRDWATVGAIAIKPGLANGKGQIVIEAVPTGNGRKNGKGQGQGRRKKKGNLPNDYSAQDANDDLFPG